MTKKKLTILLAGILGGISPLVAETVEERLNKQEKEIAAIRSQLKDTNNSRLGFPAWFNLHGEWEFEYVDAQADPNQDTSANSHARWQHDKFLLKPKITLSDNLYIKGELEFSTSTARLEEYHAHFTGLPMNSYIQMGLDERFSKADKNFDMANRKTENYPLIGSALWRDEEFAVIWGGKNNFDSGVVKDVFWRAQVSDGLELNEKQTGENDSYELTHDNDQASNTIRNKTEWGFGLGVTFQPTENYQFDIAAWVFDSELNNDEKARLLGITGYSSKDTASQTHIGNTQRRTGFRSTHKVGNSTLTYELARAEDAKLRRKGYYVQGSHKFKFSPLFGGEFVSSIEPLIRFEEYDTNMTKVFGDAETWDRQQTMYALLIGLTSNKKLKSSLKLEYTQNDERTGALVGITTQSRNPKNDEFLAQFEFKF